MKKTLTLAAGMFALCGSGFASLTESFTHVTATQSAPFVDNFNLTGFDTTLGTLTGVTIKLTEVSNATLDILNRTGINQSFTNGIVDIPFTVTTLGLSTTVSPSGAIASGSLTPHEFVQLAVPTFSGSTTTNVPVADLHSFETGSFAVSFSGSVGGGSYGGSSTPNALLFGGGADVGGTTTVTYIYTTTTTPEPVLFTVLGFGLVGLVTITKKRITKS